MGRAGRIIGGLIALALVAGVAVFAYIWFSGGSGEASAPISAPTLDVSALNGAEGSEAEPTPAATAETAADATEAATEAVVAADSTAEAAAQGAAEGIVFSIVPEESEVRFLIDEELRGEPVTVVGVTDQVAGQIFVNFDNPVQSQVGTIRINARTLRTDNDFRNRALRGQILLSAQDEFEFIEFVPTDIDGMPETVTVGEALTFQLTGDLTVKGVTRPVTFETTVTAEDETTLRGSATATVLHEDFEITIPEVPSVANVSDEVGLEIDFVARAGDAA